jgi:iron complex outermembrane receptor protein
MNRILSVVFLFLSFASAVVSQTAGRISGTVYLGDENAVIHGAAVQITELKLRTITDDAGHYEFNNVPPGRYTVNAHQEGFGDLSQRIDLTAGGNVTSDFRLRIAGIQENVTVTASGTETSTLESVASVDTLNSAQITSRASVGLGEVLDEEPGVAKRSSGPGTSRPVIRGFDGDRVKISADGIGVGSLASQSGDHSEPIDTLALERIEIVKGPATLLYGSSAIGGVVNAISGHDEDVHPGLRGYFSGIGGSNNSQAAASGGIEYGRGRWMMWSNASTQRTGDYSAGGDFGTVENTFTRNTAGSLGGGYYGEHWFLNSTYNYYQNRYGIPLDTRETDPEHRSLRVWRGDAKFNFGLKDLPAAITAVKITLDLSNYRHQELSDNIVGTTFRNKVSSYRALFEQKKAGLLTGRFGFEGFSRDFSTVGDEVLVDGPVAQDSFSLFGLEELGFERATLQFGGRVEHNAYDPDNPGLPDRSFTGFSGAAGAKFNLWTGGVFVANYTHGYRAAALEELYNHGPHDGSLLFEVGDAHLKPETSNGIDLSLRHQTAHIKAEANFYYYAFNDFVFLAPSGMRDPGSGFEIADYLQQDSRFTGTELSLDTAVNKYLNVITAYDYVNAELSSGQPLPRISPMRGRLALNFHYRNLKLEPEFVAVGRQERIFTNETPTAGYGTANLTASYILTGKHSAHVFAVNAYNLNDKLYFNHISFIKDISPEIGRGFRATYTLRFF